MVQNLKDLFRLAAEVYQGLPRGIKLALIQILGAVVPYFGIVLGANQMALINLALWNAINMVPLVGQLLGAFFLGGDWLAYVWFGWILVNVVAGWRTVLKKRSSLHKT